MKLRLKSRKKARAHRGKGRVVGKSKPAHVHFLSQGKGLRFDSLCDDGKPPEGLCLNKMTPVAI